MKKIIYTSLITLLLTLMSQQLKAMSVSGENTVKVTITNTTGKGCFFQKDGSKYVPMNLDPKGKCTFTTQLQTPAYYIYIDGKQKFTSVYLTPGVNIEITEDTNGVIVKGDNAAISNYINQNRYVGKASQGVELYSDEWKKACAKELTELNTKLEQNNFPEDFVKRHKLYYQYVYYNQVLSGPIFASFINKPIANLPQDYYAFLSTVKFDDQRIITIPQWFKTTLTAFEEMEKHGMLTVDKDRFMRIYADKIENKEVRSRFLVELLSQTLQKGYSDNFPAYLQSIRGEITGSEDLALLKEVENKYTTLKEANKNIMRGMKAPDFAAVDVSGKEYKMSDFAGKVVVIDFWFTGCIPCKAEMPYMDKIAESLKDENIQFISMSLDTGSQLLAAWNTMMKDKKDAVLNLNIPQGFKSELVQKYGIRSVPRIVIVGKDGNIYDSNTLRPSDPKLKQTLEALLGKNDAKAEIGKCMTELMKAESAEAKDVILKKAIERFKTNMEVSPMLNMMAFQVIQSLAKERKYDRTDAYLANIPPSGFRRDVVFLVSIACFENKDIDVAAKYAKEAAETTDISARAATADEDEKKKLGTISKIYGSILVEQGKIAEATKWIEQAYEDGKRADFDLQKDYVAVCMYKKEYAKANEVLENIFRNGMGSEMLKAQFKEAYKEKNGSIEGFDVYVETLQKESEEKQKQELTKKMISEPAPLFTLKNLKGETVSLAALKGKVVILDFWATWCGPCKNSFPAMQKAANKYKDKDVAFLFIDTWESLANPLPAVKKYIEEHNYNFNVLFDLKDPVSKTCKVVESYGAKGIPAKYIIDKAGNIRFKLVGFTGSDEQAVSELSTMIDALI